MIGAFEANVPSVGIFWTVTTTAERARLLAAGCPLNAAELYGDFLTYPDGHYEIWERWRALKIPDQALWAVVRNYEYEDWPRGRIVFDRVRVHFLIYADRKLMTPETIAQIRKRFAIPLKQSTVQADFHYQSREAPGPLA